MSKLKKVEKGDIAKTSFKTKTDKSGQRLMICQNSEPNNKYWKGSICNNWTAVSNSTSAVICYSCTQKLVDPPIQKTAIQKSDKPKGWKFMKVYVHTDGSVYHKGEEQVHLKGTLPVTVIEVKDVKKKLSKDEKFERIKELGLEISKLKALLFTDLKKTKRAEVAKQLNRATKEFKKLH